MRQTSIRDYKDDVDLILVHCSQTGATYAVPIEDATKTQGTLRIRPTANCQAKGIRWARDYELPA
jgi:PD-(D/E)XK nuclease superfamily protein